MNFLITMIRNMDWQTQNGVTRFGFALPLVNISRLDRVASISRSVPLGSVLNSIPSIDKTFVFQTNRMIFSILFLCLACFVVCNHHVNTNAKSLRIGIDETGER